QGAIAGTLDLSTNPNPSVFVVRSDPASSNTEFKIGAGVALADVAGAGPPIVDLLTADTDIPFGVILYDPQSNNKGKGAVMEVAQKGAVVRMLAAAALARGAKVSLDVAAEGYVKAVAANAQFGYLLDKAAGADELVRVLVTTEGA
ncbi:MAG: hypothetical protein KAJ19_08875, partial [Gammaproteobacteria bacterium]|nr:hypothetical protein [Gammaproteobacteria bacterium]